MMRTYNINKEEVFNKIADFYSRWRGVGIGRTREAYIIRTRRSRAAWKLIKEIMNQTNERK